MSLSLFFCRLPSNWVADPSQCWFEWQGLLSGILAVGAAVVSILFLKRQIAQTSDLHKDELARRHNAVRSVVPVALSAISEYCNAVVDCIATAVEDRQDVFEAAFNDAMHGRLQQKSFEPVQFPSDVISTMQLFVETLTRSADVRHMAELLSSLQILQSRFKDFDLTQVAVERGLHSLLLDASKVRLLSDSVFNYARFVDEGSFSKLDGSDLNATWNEILGKAQSLVFSRPVPDIFFQTLEELVNGCKENRISPWNEKFS